MPRPRTMEPKLFQRGAKGNYFFRIFAEKKTPPVNTGTKNLKEAEEFRRRYMISEMTCKADVELGECAIKAADKVVKTITGKPLERLTFPEGYSLYLDHCPEEEDLSERYRKTCHSIMDRFCKWCESLGIEYLDQVDHSVAIRYSKLLWQSGITEGTHDRHIKVLSKIFATIDAIRNLPNRNPFCDKIVKRRRRGMETDGAHRAFEPDMVEAIMKKAGEAGQDWLDLFIVGHQTGMRLKDATLFRWEHVQGDFIVYCPYKTQKHRTMARMPISATLRALLTRRRAERAFSPYVIPTIAHFYTKSDWVTKHCQDIIVRALGIDNTQYPPGQHRSRAVSIYSFHSFRTTMATLLAQAQTPYRDAMRMLGWRSMEMVTHYERMLEVFRGDNDQRCKNIIDNMSGLQVDTDKIELPTPRLIPTPEALVRLMEKYSNITIGRIYGISDVAVGRWLGKYDLVRTKRILSPELTEEEIQTIRQELQVA